MIFRKNILSLMNLNFFFIFLKTKCLFYYYPLYIIYIILSYYLKQTRGLSSLLFLAMTCQICLIQKFLKEGLASPFKQSHNLMLTG